MVTMLDSRRMARDAAWKGAALLRRLRYMAWSLPRSPRELASAPRLLGAYRQRGWFASVAARAPVDREGHPLPLLSYPTIDWLDGVLQPEDRVFEYGMGGSTVWFAGRVAHVTSVDHNPEWVRSLRLPGNVTARVALTRADLLTADANDPYVCAIDEGDKRYDVVLIDGMARLSCVPAAHRALTPTGLIIFDNSEKPTYAPARQQLAEWGYSRIDFCGTRPDASAFLGCTSVYGRAIDLWLRRARAPRYWGRSIEEYDRLSVPTGPPREAARPSR
jgi:Methyltransferase domain